MCARFGLSVPKEDLERFLGLELPFEIPPAYNIAPTENTVAMVSVAGSGSSEIKFQSILLTILVVVMI